MRRGTQLEGRVALVTGGGGEIGGAICAQFALQGACVVAADLRLDAAQAVAAAIESAGGRAIAVACDVSVPPDAERAVGAAVTAFGKLTTLVNTAAYPSLDGTVETMSFETWNRTLLVNLTGAFTMCKYAVPALRKAGGGAIVNLASQLGQVGVPGRAHYSSSKAALIQFTKCIAGDHAGDNIRVNSLSPGAINTAASSRRYGGREEADRVRGPWHLLGRKGRVEEIAAAALFLVSDDSSFMTGTDLLIDGGYLAFKGTLSAPG
jgi:NAD(P)-dependent dehydrogenase (short-subunit alcohol dehydrogenase family)